MKKDREKCPKCGERLTGTIWRGVLGTWGWCGIASCNHKWPTDKGRRPCTRVATQTEIDEAKESAKRLRQLAKEARLKIVENKP